MQMLACGQKQRLLPAGKKGDQIDAQSLQRARPTPCSPGQDTTPCACAGGLVFLVVEKPFPLALLARCARRKGLLRRWCKVMWRKSGDRNAVGKKRASNGCKAAKRQGQPLACIFPLLKSPLTSCPTLCPLLPQRKNKNRCNYHQ